MKAFKRGESLQRPELKEMFSDVYGGEEPWTLVSCAYCLSSALSPTCFAEGATRRVTSLTEEIWKLLGTLEERAEEV